MGNPDILLFTCGQLLKLYHLPVGKWVILTPYHLLVGMCITLTAISFTCGHMGNPDTLLFTCGHVHNSYSGIIYIWVILTPYYLPVGMWVTLTAVSFLFTFCPPGPLDLNVSIFNSFGSISIFTCKRESY